MRQPFTLVSLFIPFACLAVACSASDDPPPPSTAPVSAAPGEDSDEGQGDTDSPGGGGGEGPGVPAPGSDVSGGTPSNPGGGGAVSNPGGAVVETMPDIIVDTMLPTPAGCGDGELTEDEACDDGNTADGDGCAANCLSVSPGYSCAQPGALCQPIARCGDGFVAPSEQCDDENTVSGDGCSDRCKVELGKKCEGVPSVCSDATCGDGIQEGAEACDDGNNLPFDGCSSICLREPDCQGLSCTSDCGDGLVINEECDDGNQVSGDGCSAECTIEGGFTCERATACERINDECILRVPAIFRDFAGSHPDFGEQECDTLAQGALQEQLDAEGRPVMRGGTLPDDPCLSSESNFAEWYSSSAADAVHVDELVLFDNGRGGYVNRFNNEGDYFTATEGDNSYPGGATMAACEASCREFVSNEDFNSGCNNYCNRETQEAQQAPQRLADAERQLDDAIRQFGDQITDAGVPPQVATAQAAVEAAADAVEAAEAAVTACQTECTDGIDAGAAECAATCLPCSTGTGFCTGGQLVEHEGNPLFFPIDSIGGNLGMCAGDSPTGDCARVPEQYGYVGWPWEHEIFPGATEHNFYFTSEVQYWFQYEADMNATLDFTGDDDVWVFINGELVVDIGGIHVPVNGSFTINAAQGTIETTVIEPSKNLGEPPVRTLNDNFTTAQFGLEPGNVYKITIFHAERQKEGSSFRLTLSGFEATPSDCTAVCGDGVLSFGEECDQGDEANVGGYGGCNADCTLGEFCGDGVVNGPEDCDNGPGGGAGCPSCRILRVR